MRLGGPILTPPRDPYDWITALRSLGYTAAYWPLADGAGEDLERAYVEAATRAGIVIAEVGAWSNPLSPDDAERAEALRYCQTQLALSERVGARCCVNIAGSRGPKWDGPAAADLTPETFDLIVETVRAIIDAVKPTRTFYTLETMPWMYPDSVESYQRLLAAIDRPAFGVHFDPVNLVCSPQRYYATGALVRSFVAALGPHIRSCHAKDIILRDRATVHLDEIRPGLGGLDYRVLLTELNSLDPDLPLMLEHLEKAEDYVDAAAYIRGAAREVGVSLRQ
ncbi:MAG: sugar phosphate isomerase/epimerase family protein [Anaerolineae bacterium]